MLDTPNLGSRSGIPVLPDVRCTRRESLPRVLHHVHLEVRSVGSSVRAEDALVHRLLAALVNHVPAEILHFVITTIAVVARESTLSARSSSIPRHLADVILAIRVICNQGEQSVTY